MDAARRAALLRSSTALCLEVAKTLEDDVLFDIAFQTEGDVEDEPPIVPLCKDSVCKMVTRSTNASTLASARSSLDHDAFECSPVAFAGFPSFRRPRAESDCVTEGSLSSSCLGDVENLGDEEAPLELLLDLDAAIDARSASSSSLSSASCRGEPPSQALQPHGDLDVPQDAALLSPTSPARSPAAARAPAAAASASSSSAPPPAAAVVVQEPPKAVVADPAAEMGALGAKLVGRWVTDVKRCDIYEPLLKRLGVGMMKRKVMNAYAVRVFKEIKGPHDLVCVAHMPLGVKKEMLWRLDGSAFTVKDDDAGDWRAQCRASEFLGQRELQLVRTNDKGQMVETRRLVGDAQWGNVVHIHIVFTPAKVTPSDPVIELNRYMRPLKANE